MNGKQLLRSQAGVTLTEVMISVAVVATTTLGFMSLYTSTKRSSEKNIHKNSCQGYVNAVAARIRGMGTTNTIEPIDNALWTGNTVGLAMTAANVDTAGDTEPGVARATRWPGGGAYSTHEVLGPNMVLHNAHLIHGAINGMLAVYNSNPAGYCNNFTAYNYSPANITQKLLPVNADGTADMFGMRNVVPAIQIIPYSRSTGTTTDRAGTAIGCPANLTIVPRGGRVNGNDFFPAQYWGGDMPTVSQAGNQINEYFAGGGVTGPVLVNGGLRIRIRVVYDDKQDIQQSCEGEIKLEYADDVAQTGARAGAQPNGGNPYGLVWNAAYGNRDGGAESFNGVQFRAGYIPGNFEPGSVLFCRDRSWRIQQGGGSALQPAACTMGGSNLVWMSDHSRSRVGFCNTGFPVCDGWSLDRDDYRMPQSYYTEIGGADFGGATAGYVAPNRAYNFMLNNTWPKLNWDTINDSGGTARNWVHCGQLTQCSQPPAATVRQVVNVAGTDHYVWQLTYNNIQQGCVFAADVAVVDTAGNVAIVSQTAGGGPTQVSTGAPPNDFYRRDRAYTAANFNTIYYRTCNAKCNAVAGVGGQFGCADIGP